MRTKKKSTEVRRTKNPTLLFQCKKSCPNFEREHVSTEEEEFFHFERS
jgi:hypothetical protein